MSKKSEKISALIDGCRGGEFSPYYLGYFECFNRQLFFEAHDVLEELWLKDKQSPNYAFYKGLIQLAGAFVHLQKDRLRPSAALFKLARTNLERYPILHEKLDIGQVIVLINQWLFQLETANFERNPLHSSPPPTISLDRKS